MEVMILLKSIKYYLLSPSALDPPSTKLMCLGFVHQVSRFCCICLSTMCLGFAYGLHGGVQNGFNEFVI